MANWNINYWTMCVCGTVIIYFFEWCSPNLGEFFLLYVNDNSLFCWLLMSILWKFLDFSLCASFFCLVLCSINPHLHFLLLYSQLYYTFTLSLGNPTVFTEVSSHCLIVYHISQGSKSGQSWSSNCLLPIFYRLLLFIFPDTVH